MDRDEEFCMGLSRSVSSTPVFHAIHSTENAVVVASHSGSLAFLSVSVCHLKG